VVALVGLYLVDNAVNAGVAFEGRRVQLEARTDVFEAGKPVVGIFERHPAYNSMYFIALRQEAFRKIGTVLPGDTRDERTLRGHLE
jgi:hypothetical protein